MSPPQFPQITALGELSSYGPNLPVIPHATAYVRICHPTNCSHFLGLFCGSGSKYKVQ